MEKRLMTQHEIAEKYDTDGTSVSLALSKVQPAGVKTNGKYKTKTYDEKEAAEALKGLYMIRKRRHLQRAAAWHAEMLAVDRIYEEGGERCDYIGPVNGKLGLQEQMEREMEEMVR